MKFRWTKAISFLLSVAMLVSMLPAVYASETTEDTSSQTEDLFEKFADKGIYTESNQEADVSDGLSVHNAANTLLIDVDDTETLTAAGVADDVVATAKELGYQYVSAAADGPWDYRTVTDANGVAKDAWFTTKAYRGVGSWKTLSGFIYFKVTNTAISATDTDLTFIVEYYDEGTTAINVKLWNNVVGYISRTGTNTWKTAVVNVSGASISSANSGTGMADGTCDFRIEGNGFDTYISKVKVLKTEDYNAGIKGEDQEVVEPEEGGDPTIFIAGDSIAEIYTDSVFPRVGWGMEISEFFLDNVNFVNKSKGGKSTRTFLSGHDPTVADDYYDTRMQDIINMSKKGDWLFVNLGCNDATNGRDSVKTSASLGEDVTDGTSYKANLVEFINIANENGLNLVFITAPHGRKFSGTSIGNDGIYAHREAMKEIGLKYGVPVLDLGTRHGQLIEDLGTEFSKKIFMYATEEEYPELASWVSRSDNTHVSQAGAIEISKIIVQLIKEGAEAGNPTLTELYKLVDTTVDTTLMTKPRVQSYSANYDVTDIVYTVDGTESDVYYAGDVAATATVANKGTASNTATLYLAVYDKDNKLVDISKSDAVSIEAGASAEVSADAVTLPDQDSYSFRKFIWASNLKPYSTADETVKLSVAAYGYNRNALITWTELAELGDDVTFELYRDDVLIAETQGSAFLDEGVTRGEHQYQINVVDSTGEVVYQSAIALATVTSMYDVKNDASVVYTKAKLDMNGNEADISKGISCYRTNKLYPVDEAKEYFTYLTDEQIEYAKANGFSYITNGSDGPVRTIPVTDSMGVTKPAWHTGKVMVSKDATATLSRSGFMYIKVLDDSITTSDEKLTVFVEYLSNRSSFALEYCNFTTDEEGNKVTDDANGNQLKTSLSAGNPKTGTWRVAKFEIDNAYFDHSNTLYFDGKVDMRFSSNWSDLYISSVMIVKGTGNEALAKYAALNDHDFTDDETGKGSQLYPDGVSIDFSTGTAVSNGIRGYYSTGGTADNTGAIVKDDDGQYYMSTSHVIYNDAFKQTYMYFDIDDRYMFGGVDSKYEVELTYKAEYDTDIAILANSYYRDSSSYSGNVNAIKAVTKNEAEPWQTVTFTVDNHSFNSLDNGGCDIRMYIPGNLSDTNKQLKVRKLVIRKASATDRVRYVDDNGEFVPKFFIASDSIAANYSSGVRYGWGMKIGDYMNGVSVVNKASPAKSTKDFPNMPAILGAAKKGDYVAIQFGHNDSWLAAPNGRGCTVDEYKVNLQNYIINIRKVGATPILLTSTPSYSVDNGAYFYGDDSVMPYRVAAMEVAEDMNVAAVDVAAIMVESTSDMTVAEIEALYDPTEETSRKLHLSESGADFVADIIAQGIKSHERTISLKDYIK